MEERQRAAVVAGPATGRELASPVAAGLAKARQRESESCCTICSRPGWRSRIGLLCCTHTQAAASRIQDGKDGNSWPAAATRRCRRSSAATSSLSKLEPFRAQRGGSTSAHASANSRRARFFTRASASTSDSRRQRRRSRRHAWRQTGGVDDVLGGRGGPEAMALAEGRSSKGGSGKVAAVVAKVAAARAASWKPDAVARMQGAPPTRCCRKE